MRPRDALVWNHFLPLHGLARFEAAMCSFYATLVSCSRSSTTGGKTDDALTSTGFPVFEIRPRKLGSSTGCTAFRPVPWAIARLLAKASSNFDCTSALGIGSIVDALEKIGSCCSVAATNPLSNETSSEQRNTGPIGNGDRNEGI